MATLESYNRDTGPIAVIPHPNHAYRKLADQVQDELRSSSLAPYLMPQVYLSQFTWQENAALILDSVEPGTRLGLVGGDGMWRAFMKSILRIIREVTADERALAVTLAATSVAGGNGRDIGRAQHGRRRMDAPPSWIFSHARRVEAYGLDYMAVLPGRSPDEAVTITDQAMSYMGFGATAMGVAALNSPEYAKGRRFIRDVQLGWSALHSDYAFTMTDECGERNVRDITIAKGSAIAKIGRLSVEHWEPPMFITETRPSQVANYMSAAGVLSGFKHGAYTQGAYWFTPLGCIDMYADGDPPITIKGGEPVEVAPTPEAYGMLITRPAPDHHSGGLFRRKHIF